MGRYIGPGGIVEDDYGPIDRPRSSKMNICIMQKFHRPFLVVNAQRSLDNWQISVPRGLATPCAVIWVIYWFLPPRFYPLGHPRGIFWAAIIFHQLIRLTWFFFVWEILSFPSTTIQFRLMHIVFFCSSYPYFDSRSIFSKRIFRVIGAQTPHVGSWGSKKIFFRNFKT